MGKQALERQGLTGAAGGPWALVLHLVKRMWVPVGGRATMSCVGSTTGDDPLSQHMGCHRVSPVPVPWPQILLNPNSLQPSGITLGS